MVEPHASDDGALEARAAAFAQAIPDYEDSIDAMVAAGKDVALPPYIAEFLNTSPVCIVLGYRLVKRLDLLKWILDLAPAEATEVLTWLDSQVRLDIEARLSPSPITCWHCPFSEDFWAACTPEFIQAQMRLVRLFAWSASPDSRPH